jgi:urease accessory protein
MAPAARIGAAGPAGSGKTALIERLIAVFHQRNVNLAVVTNDLVVDWRIFAIDVAGGDRKQEPGVPRGDLPIVNKADLAPFAGVNLSRMLTGADDVRGGRPVIASKGKGVEAVADATEHAVLFAT